MILIYYILYNYTEVFQETLIENLLFVENMGSLLVTDSKTLCPLPHSLVTYGF